MTVLARLDKKEGGTTNDTHKRIIHVKFEATKRRRKLIDGNNDEHRAPLVVINFPLQITTLLLLFDYYITPRKEIHQSNIKEEKNG